jgi:hypothetical protein
LKADKLKSNPLAGSPVRFWISSLVISPPHMRDLYLDEYPFRKLLARLNEIGFGGFCLAEIPESQDPIRVMKYFRALFLAYQDLL